MSMTDSQVKDRGDAGQIFEFNVAPPRVGLPLAVRWVAREVVVPDVGIDTSREDTGFNLFVTVKYAIRGSGTLTANEERLHVEEGMVFWTMPQMPYRLEADAGQVLENYVLLLSGTEVGAICRRYLQRDVGALRTARPAHTQSIIECLVGEAKGSCDHREENCLNLAQVLLGNVASAVRDSAMSARTFRRCKAYIQKHFATVNSLSDVAEPLSLTVSHLCRLFDRFHSSSPYDYIRQLKMGTAEYMLLTGDRSIRQIAESIGYRDSCLFSKNFKVATGKSPRAYRKIHLVSCR